MLHVPFSLLMNFYKKVLGRQNLFIINSTFLFVCYLPDLEIDKSPLQSGCLTKNKDVIVANAQLSGTRNKCIENCTKDQKKNSSE